MSLTSLEKIENDTYVSKVEILTSSLKDRVLQEDRRLTSSAISLNTLPAVDWAPRYMPKGTEGRKWIQLI